MGLDLLGDVLVKMAAIVGAVTGVWAKVDQIRGERERRRREDPYATASIGPPDNDGWFVAKLLFENPRGNRFRIHRVEVVSPKGMVAAVRIRGLAHTQRDPASSGRVMEVDWEVGKPLSETVSAGRVMLFLKPASAAASSKVRLRLHAREISASKRKFRMEATAMMPIATA